MLFISSSSLRIHTFTLGELYNAPRTFFRTSPQTRGRTGRHTPIATIKFVVEAGLRIPSECGFLAQALVFDHAEEVEPANGLSVVVNS